jgi:hypothetical protein
MILSVDNREGSEMGGINYVVSPISVPLSVATLKIHINKGAYLVHVTAIEPIIFDVEGVMTDFLNPLFSMQSLGSKHNVVILNTADRRAVADGMLVWQMFGGIALPVVGDILTTLKTIDDVLTTKTIGRNKVEIATLAKHFEEECLNKGLITI